ncbi:MAG TPA: adenylate kinase [Candidatus Thermoplasmatota archaeon]|nr:adenylate kinase [Candidatus Thermoplasmatota archaeon]
MGAIIVTGIPGVGKTTVMEAAAKAQNLRIAVFGSVMFEVAQAEGLAKTRDDMRKLPPDMQKSIQREAAVRIAAMGKVIVDTHCTVKTPKGYLPGLPAWVLEALKPATIVLVEAGDEEISKRRANDSSRKRDDDSVAAIAEHQEYNRRFAAAYATLTGATVCTVRNADGKVEQAMKDILEVVS